MLEFRGRLAQLVNIRFVKFSTLRDRGWNLAVRQDFFMCDKYFALMHDPDFFEKCQQDLATSNS